MTTFVFPGAFWPLDFWPAAYWPVIDGEVEPPPTLLPDLSWINGFYALMLVGDEYGRLIGELSGDITALSYELNAVGRAKITVPPRLAHLIEFGNRLLIYLDNGLPPWAGFIDPPRGWKYGGIGLTAYSGERLLQHRVTGRNQVFTQRVGIEWRKSTCPIKITG